MTCSSTCVAPDTVGSSGASLTDTSRSRNAPCAVRKSIATCAGRFGNTLNFRGEPYLPGVDLLTRYPGG